MTASLAEHAFSLQDYIDGEVREVKVLPLIHSTGSKRFIEIADRDELSVSTCPYYKEFLLYLFYGRPAYRPFAKTLSTSDSVFRPISILLQPWLEVAAKRVIPLDSGAFAEGAFSAHCGDLLKEHFELAGQESSPKFVSAFYGDNKSYYLSRLRSDLKHDPTRLVVSAYKSIVSKAGETPNDDRRSTIEVQVDAAIELDETSVMAVCLPEDFLENEQIRRKITEDWKADVIPYDIYHDRPVHDVREIMARVKDYLTAKELV